MLNPTYVPPAAAPSFIADTIKAPPVLTVVQNPDAALLDKVRRRNALWNRVGELGEFESGQMIVGDDGALVVLEDEHDRILDELINVEREIAAIPARTVTGLAAKLALVNDDPLAEDERDPVKLLVASAWRDAQRLSGQPALVPAALVPAASVSPDADLLALWEVWLSTYREFCATEHDEAEDQAWNRLVAIESRMREMPARTPQGVSVKLRWLFRENADSRQVPDAITKGSPLDGSQFGASDAMFWKLISEVEQMALQRASEAAPVDAHIRALWDEHRKAADEFDAAPDTIENDEIYSKLLNKAERRFEEAPASNIDGIVLKTRYLLRDMVSREDNWRELVPKAERGDPINPDDCEDYNAGYVARLAADIERLAAQQVTR